MPRCEATVELSAHAGHSVEVPGVLWHFTILDRLRRAGVILLVALLLAASLLPIPIIHLIGPPLILLTGVVVALRQLRATARLGPVSIACPKCGEANRLGGGLGMRLPLAQTTRICSSCRRVLTLTVREFATLEP